MKVGILGTRGIPNRYGGFERFAEYLSKGLVQRDHEVSVYCPSYHEHTSNQYQGVHLIKCYDPEPEIGTVGQFIYDLNCILDSRKRNFDALLLLGYTSSSIWGSFLPSAPVIFSNMDGYEWKRSKYKNWVRKFLKRAEKWAVQQSDVLIADSPLIQQYYIEKYRQQAHYIPYAAEVFRDPDIAAIRTYDIEAEQYDLLIARMEPENNIECIIKGRVRSNTSFPLIIIGNTHTPYGRKLKEDYASNSIRFLEGIYEQDVLNNLRHFSRLYFHGHSVGGTNPSLLEAMAANALIAAHQNDFNTHVLKDQAFYWKNSDDITHLCDKIQKKEYRHYLSANRERIKSVYSTDRIVEAYEKLLMEHN